MAGYKPELDKVLWESDPVEFKPKATLRAKIKSYNGGEPKVMLIEDGEGYSGKNYSGTLMKRVGIEDISLVFDLLQKAQPKLDEMATEYAIKKGRKK